MAPHINGILVIITFEAVRVLYVVIYDRLFQFVERRVVRRCRCIVFHARLPSAPLCLSSEALIILYVNTIMRNSFIDSHRLMCVCDCVSLFR